MTRDEKGHRSLDPGSHAAGPSEIESIRLVVFQYVANSFIPEGDASFQLLAKEIGVADRCSIEVNQRGT